MRMHRTWTKDRGSFVYEYVDGARIQIRPGEDGVTEADIAALHRMDDNEIMNNLKHGKPQLQNWQREYMDRWKEEHPGEEPPKLQNVSLDAAVNPDSSDNGQDKGEVGLLCSQALMTQDEVSAETQAVRDFVGQFLTEEQRELYERILIGDESVTAVAREKGVSRKTIHKYLRIIKEIFRKNFQNFFESGYTS